jgi:hypothetical protein
MINTSIEMANIVLYVIVHNLIRIFINTSLLAFYKAVLSDK